MSNHARNKRDLLLIFSPTSQQNFQGEFAQLVKNTFASYSANEIYSSEVEGICIECVLDCLKVNSLMKKIFLSEMRNKRKLCDGWKRRFSRYLEKGKKYQFVSKISPWKTLKFREISGE